MRTHSGIGTINYEPIYLTGWLTIKSMTDPLNATENLSCYNYLILDFVRLNNLCRG